MCILMNWVDFNDKEYDDRDEVGGYYIFSVRVYDLSCVFFKSSWCIVGWR